MEKPKEKEEPYVHQHFPKAVYSRDGEGKLINKLAADADEFMKAIEEGWVESPTELPTPAEIKSAEAAKAAQLQDENAKLRAELERMMAAAKKPDADDEEIRKIEAEAAAKVVKAGPVGGRR